MYMLVPRSKTRVVINNLRISYHHSKMDAQRSMKIGKPNYWIVLAIKNPEIAKNLKLVQLHLEETFKNVRSELSQAFTDLGLFYLEYLNFHVARVLVSIRLNRRHSLDRVLSTSFWRTIVDSYLISF